MDDTPHKPLLPILAYSPDDIPSLTSGVISRSRAYADMRKGLLRAKKVGERNIIPAEEAHRYINAFPDRPTEN
jgi:hypothetical protein